MVHQHYWRRETIHGRDRFKERRRRKKTATEEKHCSLVSRINSRLELTGIDCFDSWFLFFSLSIFRTMTDYCRTSNWWVNTSSDPVALTTKIAQMLRQSNKIDYYWYSLWAVDPGILHLITWRQYPQKEKQRRTSEKFTSLLTPHLHNVTEKYMKTHFPECLGFTGGSHPRELGMLHFPFLAGR